MTDAPIPNELQRRGHSYRNYDPQEFLDAGAAALTEAIENDGQIGEEIHETQQGLRSAFGRIEAGRFKGFLMPLSRMFAALDADEQEMFTRRNPGLVEWMDVATRLEFDGRTLGELVGLADRLIEERAQGQMLDAPPFERREPRRGKSLIEDAQTRRRSYRNWSPYEFIDLWENRLPRGEVDPNDPEEYSGPAVREVFDRIEDGRMAEAADEAMTFFAPLDPDERVLFARRNPGMLMWGSVYGRMNHLIHGDQLFHLSSDDIYPTLGEVDES